MKLVVIGGGLREPDGMPVLIAATGGTERHSLVLDHALRPMFCHLHAVVAPTGSPGRPTTSVGCCG